MRLSPTAALIAFACALFVPGAAGAATVTIDGTSVTNPVVVGGHILVPFRVPMEQLGATVVWSDADETGVATYAGQELVRTVIGSSVAYIGGYGKTLTVAPVLIDHVEYVPVEVLPEISNAQLTMAPDGSSATITNFDLAGVNAAGASASSNDPRGHVLYVWLWLLPISGILCLAAYVYVIGLMNKSLAVSAARRGVKTKKLGLFV